MIGSLRRIAFAGVVLTGLVLAALGTGCGRQGAPAAGPPEPQPDPPPVVAAPGLYDRDGDEVGAVGVFALLDEEEGSWAVVGVADTETAQSFVVALVEGAEDLGVDLEAYRGRYVEVRGTRVSPDASGSQAPRIRARAIGVLVEDDPADPVP